MPIIVVSTAIPMVTSISEKPWSLLAFIRPSGLRDNERDRKAISQTGRRVNLNYLDCYRTHIPCCRRSSYHLPADIERARRAVSHCCAVTGIARCVVQIAADRQLGILICGTPYRATQLVCLILRSGRDNAQRVGSTVCS